MRRPASPRRRPKRRIGGVPRPKPDTLRRFASFRTPSWMGLSRVLPEKGSVRAAYPITSIRPEPLRRDRGYDPLQTFLSQPARILPAQRKIQLLIGEDLPAVQDLGRVVLENHMREVIDSHLQLLSTPDHFDQVSRGPQEPCELPRERHPEQLQHRAVLPERDDVAGRLEPEGRHGLSLGALDERPSDVGPHGDPRLRQRGSVGAIGTQRGRAVSHHEYVFDRFPLRIERPKVVVHTNPAILDMKDRQAGDEIRGTNARSPDDREPLDLAPVGEVDALGLHAGGRTPDEHPYPTAHEKAVDVG